MPPPPPTLLSSLLPLDLLLLVVRYCTAYDIVLLGRTCRHLHALCNKNAAVWQMLILRDYAPSLGHLAGLQSAKAIYLDRAGVFHAHREHQKQAKLQLNQRTALAWEQQSLHRACDLAFGFRTCLLMTGLCGLATAITLLQVQEDAYYPPLIPVWVWLAYLLSTVLAAACVLLLLPKQLWEASSNAAVLGASYFARRHRGFDGQLMAMLCTAGVLLLLVALFSAFIPSASSLSWPSVFAPLWCALLLSMCVLFTRTGRTSTDGEVLGCTLCACMLLPWLVFAVLLAVWLEDTNWTSLANVFIPLYIQLAFFYLFLFGVTKHGGLGACCHATCRCGPVDEHGERSPSVAGPPYRYFRLVADTLCLAGAPVIAFEVLVAQSSASQVLVPVLVWFGLLTVMSAVAVCRWVDEDKIEWCCGEVYPQQHDAYSRPQRRRPEQEPRLVRNGGAPPQQAAILADGARRQARDDVEAQQQHVM